MMSAMVKSMADIVFFLSCQFKIVNRSFFSQTLTMNYCCKSYNWSCKFVFFCKTIRILNDVYHVKIHARDYFTRITSLQGASLNLKLLIIEN